MKDKSCERVFLAKSTMSIITEVRWDVVLDDRDQNCNFKLTIDG